MNVELTVIVSVNSLDPDWTARRIRESADGHKLNDAILEALRNVLELPTGATLTGVSVSSHRPDPLTGIALNFIAAMERARREYDAALRTVTP